MGLEFDIFHKLNNNGYSFKTNFFIIARNTPCHDKGAISVGIFLPIL